MTTVRVLTPAGRGAVAVVEVAGPDATRLVDDRFVGRGPLAAAPINAIRFGHWRRDDGLPGEEIVAVRTGDDLLEVHCHGGVAASKAIVAALAACGAAAATTEETPDDVAGMLASAPTERVAGVLLDQLNGALVEAVRSTLAAIEERETTRASAFVAELLGRERLAARLTTPWRVVIAGAPNVGKSSLVNALVGYERAIVYDRPGTTRDVVTAATAIGGWPVTLADTAGVRETDDPLEAAGVELARQTLRTADVVVVVCEAASLTDRMSLARRERLLADAATGAAVVDVASKIDLAPAGCVLPARVIGTCPPQGVGVEAALAAIEQAFAIGDPPAGAAVPLERWRYDRLRAAQAALKGGGLARASEALRALLAGEKP